MSDFFNAKGRGQPCNLPELWDSIAMGHMQRVVAAGGLVGFCLTSDGGVLCVSVTLDGDHRKEYFRELDDFTAFALEAAEAVEAVAGSQRRAASPASRKRRS